MATKLTAAWNAGSRIVPSRTSNNDQEYQLRIDAGQMLNDRHRMIYLQVNSQAKSTKLKEWIRKHGTHANLASAQFDTLADDPEAETDRVLEELEAAAKNEV